MIVTITFDSSFHSKLFHCKQSTAANIITTSKIPVMALQLKKDTNSFKVFTASVYLLSNTYLLFVINANTTAANHAKIVLITLLNSARLYKAP